MKVKITVSTGLVKSEKTKVIDIPDGLTQEEIEQEAITAMWEIIDFSYDIVEN